VLTAAEHRHRAEQAAAGGDLRTAVLERFRAIARELEERALLAPAAGRTAGEIASAGGRELPRLAPRLAAAARRFDAVRYGDHTPRTEEVAELVAVDDELRRSKPLPVAASAVPAAADPANPADPAGPA